MAQISYSSKTSQFYINLYKLIFSVYLIMCVYSFSILFMKMPTRLATTFKMTS